MFLHFLVVVVKPADRKISRSGICARYNNFLAASSARCSNLYLSLREDKELNVCSGPRIFHAWAPASILVHRTCFHLFCCVKE